MFQSSMLFLNQIVKTKQNNLFLSVAVKPLYYLYFFLKIEDQIIKIFHETLIFFNEVFFTASYCCCIRYFQERKKIILYIFLAFLPCHFSMQKCLLGQTKQRVTLLTIFRARGCSTTPLIIFYIFHTNFQLPAYQNSPPPSPFFRDLRVVFEIKSIQSLYFQSNFYYFVIMSPTFISINSNL